MRLWGYPYYEAVDKEEFETRLYTDLNPELDYIPYNEFQWLLLNEKIAIILSWKNISVCVAVKITWEYRQILWEVLDWSVWNFTENAIMFYEKFWDEVLAWLSDIFNSRFDYRSMFMVFVHLLNWSQPEFIQGIKPNQELLLKLAEYLSWEKLWDILDVREDDQWKASGIIMLMKEKWMHWKIADICQRWINIWSTNAWNRVMTMSWIRLALIPNNIAKIKQWIYDYQF